MSIAVAQNVVVVPTLATFNSSPVATFVPGGAQLAYLQGQVTELDGGQAFYQARDNDFSTATSFPDIIADSTGLRWSVTTSVTQAQIVSALTSAGTLPGLDPLTTQGANIASATTTDLSAATGNYINITGTTTITGLGTIAAGKLRFVTFTGILTLTNNATSLILPGGANITTAAGDSAIFVSLGSGNWKCIVYTEAAGGTPGTLGVPQGGTGVTTIAANGIPYGAGASPIGVTAQGAAGTVLHGNGASAPSFSAVVLTTDVSGILPVANGGTGLASGTSGGVLAYTASGTLASSAALTANALVLGGGAGVAPGPLGSLGTTTTVLHGNAAGAPTFGAVVLTTDVSGVLPVANGGTGVGTQNWFTSVATQVFTANGTYTPTAGMKFCIIECIGGGGAGGGQGAAGAGTANGSGGGGAGGYARRLATAAQVGASQVVTVGAGGTGGAGAGPAGADTSVGSLCIGKGGSGGSAGGGGAGGTGGVAGTGDFVPTGAPGGTGSSMAIVTLTCFGGAGGSSVYGGGGKQISVSATTAGSAATAYGSGGGGAVSYNGGGAANGGDGSSGVVIVTEYV